MSMSPSSHCWNYYPGTKSWSQVSAAYFKIGHLYMKFTGAHFQMSCNDLNQRQAIRMVIPVMATRVKYFIIFQLDMSTARWRLKSPGHYPLHPPTPTWLLKGHGHDHAWPIHIPFVLCQLALPFLKWGYYSFWVWPWKFKTKVMGMVKRQGGIFGPVSNWFAFFFFFSHQSDEPFLRYSYIPEIQLFQIWPWKIQGQGQKWGQRSWSHSWPSTCTQSMHFLFVSYQSDLPFLRYDQ